MSSRGAIEDSVEQFGPPFLTGEPQRYTKAFAESRAVGKEIG
jgi:hypothetical protein